MDLLYHIFEGEYEMGFIKLKQDGYAFRYKNISIFKYYST